MIPEIAQIPWQLGGIAILVGGIVFFVFFMYINHLNTRWIRDQTTPSVPINRKILSSITYSPNRRLASKRFTTITSEAFTTLYGSPSTSTERPMAVRRSAYLYAPSPDSIKTIVYKPTQYSLRDYYVLTSYNTCITGSYNNGIASIGALANVVATGFRCLDFEIYSEFGTDNPIVSCSVVRADDGTYPIQTSDPILFSDVMLYLTTYAFVNYGSMNCTDPLILNLRIKTNNTNIPGKLADIFEKYLRYMVDAKYNMHNIDNFGAVLLPSIMNRISIFVDAITDSYLSNDRFTRFVNMYVKSGTGNISVKHWNDFPQTGNPSDELILYNKQHITMVFPEPDVAVPVNRPITEFIKNGCQCVGIVYNQTDKVCIDNINFFNDNQSAFVLKPKLLRYTVLPITPPIPQLPQYSYTSRQITVPDSIHGVFKI